MSDELTTAQAAARLNIKPQAFRKRADRQGIHPIRVCRAEPMPHNVAYWSLSDIERVANDRRKTNGRKKILPD